MRRAIVAVSFVTLICAPVGAQDVVNIQADLQTPGNQRVQVQSPILTIDSERLFAESELGRRIRADIDKARADLQQQNDDIAKALEEEELELTERRQDLPAEEFRVLADAFDTKAQRIRAERAEELRKLGERLDEERRAFMTAAVPVLEAIMREAGAAVILEQRSVFIAVRAVDITNTAIQRIDQSVARPVPSE